MLHLGREHVICCAGVGRRDRRSRARVALARRCSRARGRVPRAILLTHIHLDHAGATGALVRRWPDAEVWVHERGAPHLVDPSKLIASATRIYGDDMQPAVGRDRAGARGPLRVLSGGERIGGCRVDVHAGPRQHHVTYLHEPTRHRVLRRRRRRQHRRRPGARADAAAGHRPRAVARVDRPDRARWTRRGSLVTHFGLVEDPARALRRAAREHGALRGSSRARSATPSSRRAVAAEIERALPTRRGRVVPAGDAARTLWAGLDRYWRKRAEAGDAVKPPPRLRGVRAELRPVEIADAAGSPRCSPSRRSRRGGASGT